MNLNTTLLLLILVTLLIGSKVQRERDSIMAEEVHTISIQLTEIYQQGK